jgi:hypothetical protein
MTSDGIELRDSMSVSSVIWRCPFLLSSARIAECVLVCGVRLIIAIDLSRLEIPVDGWMG